MSKQTPTLAKWPTRMISDQIRRRGHIVLDVFEQQLDAERSAKGLQVLDRGQRVLQGALVPLGVAIADVQYEKLVAAESPPLPARASPRPCRRCGAICHCGRH